MKTTGLAKAAAVIAAAAFMFSDCASNAKTSAAANNAATAETETAAPSGAAGVGGPKTRYVAVVETEIDAQSGAAAKLNKAEVREITAVLRDEARNNLPSGKYKIMTAETVIAQGSAVLEECSEENCVIALGAKIGADYIVRGTLSKFGTKLALSIVMYETEDGTLVASARVVSSDKAEDLLEKTVTAGKGMYKTFLNDMEGAQNPTPAQPEVVAAPQPAYQPPARPVTGGSGILTDGRDGKKYRTVVIGVQTWMAENLNYPTSNGSLCYNEDNSNCDKYGRLYDWNTAMTACPAGFHLPSRQDWQILVDYAGGNKAAGKRLKARSGWRDNGNGTDDYGFSALPGGHRNFNPFGGSSLTGIAGYWWTATPVADGYAHLRYMSLPYGNYVDEDFKSMRYALSIRCVKD